MESTDYIDPGYIIRDVSESVSDPEFKSGLTRGWYMTKIKDCLDEVSFEMPFKKRFIDLTIAPGGDIDPTVLQMQLPKQIWDIDQIYLWNGDCCTVQSSVPIYWKRQFLNGHGGTGYTATRKDGADSNFFDPFLDWDFYVPYIYPSTIFWFNVQDGIIMLSPGCTGYGHLRIVYYGTAGDIGDAPIIPRTFVKLTKDWVTWKFLQWRAIREPRAGYAGLAMAAKEDIYGPATGSWWMVADRITKMSRKERSDFAIYLNRGNW